MEPLLSSTLLLSALLGGFPPAPPQTPVTPARCVGLLCLSARPAAPREAPILSIRQAPGQVKAPLVDGRACPGCPKRRLGHAFIQATIINAFYEMANLIRGQDTAKITPSTWWLNMRRGWEWDLDDFVVNQIGHPYQGNNYFTAGRANGLDFWESSALTAFGSGTWEFFGETNQASLNDLINTTLGGIALGEMFHRTAWLMRNTRRPERPAVEGNRGHGGRSHAGHQSVHLRRLVTGRREAARICADTPRLDRGGRSALARLEPRDAQFGRVRVPRS